MSVTDIIHRLAIRLREAEAAGLFQLADDLRLAIDALERVRAPASESIDLSGQQIVCLFAQNRE
jgi:hypothetical protein